MALGDLLKHLFTNPAAATAVQGIVVLAFIDFLSGTVRALADKTFVLSLIDVWVRTKLIGRVVPIVILFLGSQVVGDLSVLGLQTNILFDTATAAAVTFAAVEA